MRKRLDYSDHSKMIHQHLTSLPLKTVAFVDDFILADKPEIMMDLKTF